MSKLFDINLLNSTKHPGDLWTCCSFFFMTSKHKFNWSTLKKRATTFTLAAETRGPPMIGSYRRTFLHKLPMRCVPMPCFWLAWCSICTPPISLVTSFSATIYTAADGCRWRWLICTRATFDWVHSPYLQAVYFKKARHMSGTRVLWNQAGPAPAVLKLCVCAWGGVCMSAYLPGCVQSVGLKALSWFYIFICWETFIFMFMVRWQCKCEDIQGVRAVNNLNYYRLSLLYA